MNTLHRFAFVAALAAAALASFSSSYAGQGGDDDQDTILIGDPIAGIDVDATGVLKIRQFDPRLAKQRFEAAKAIVKRGDADERQLIL